MDLRLTGQRVLVTGASKGIGLAVADAFAAEGAKLVLVARDRAQLEAARDTLAAQTAAADIALAVADLSDRNAAARLAQDHPDVDVLVNNAGAIPAGSLLAMDDATWRAAWDLKLFGYIAMCRAFYTGMKARGQGVIVNIIGISSMTRDPNYICGATANAALTAFTQSLGSTSHADGIRVVGLSPGPVSTERLMQLNRAKAERQWGDASRHAELLQGNPFGRAARPQEIAQAVVFAASPAASYTSGTVMVVDGGISARQAGTP
jgi:NAD(P)-dependent dehydrogenase (short-subunit alcohol dehydrogenase family)